jgi:hypothetical protein
MSHINSKSSNKNDAHTYKHTHTYSPKNESKRVDHEQTKPHTNSPPSFHLTEKKRVLQSMMVCVHIYIFLYIHMCVCVYIYIYISMCVCIYKYMCVYIYVCVCVYICMCVCVYINICVCVYKYVCVFI